MAAAPSNPYADQTVAPPAIDPSYIYEPTAQHSRAEQIFQGFLAKDELAVWIGHEKHRKTTLVLDFAVAAALGRDFLAFRFMPSTALRVVMFDYESKDDSIYRRSEAICNALHLSTDDRARLWQNLRIIKLREMIYNGGAVPKIDKCKEWWQKAVAENPADIYIVDPFRCLHGAGENDSAMEETLRKIRAVFHRATVIPHHMTKNSRNPRENTRLADDMRLWSEGCRGSGAIKGHADVIICQERETENDETEVVHLGAFMKDAADVKPISLVESATDSFLWVPHTELAKPTAVARDLLIKSGTESWEHRSDVAAVFESAGMKRSTAFARVKELLQRGVLREYMKIYAHPECRHESRITLVKKTDAVAVYEPRVMDDAAHVAEEVVM
jgi:hypothetical protein